MQRMECLTEITRKATELRLKIPSIILDEKNDYGPFKEVREYIRQLHYDTGLEVEVRPDLTDDELSELIIRVKQAGE